MSPTPTFLFTGASGFLGRHLLEALARDWPEARPVALVRSARRWRDLGWPDEIGGLRAVEGDVVAPEDWLEAPALASLDGIFHLAGQVQHSRHAPEAMWRANVEGTLNMVRLAAVRRVRTVFVSSTGTVAVSKTPGPAPDEEAPFCDDRVAGWPYYRSKVAAEREARALAERLGVELVVMRPPVLLGPRDHGFRSTGNVIRLLRGRLPFLVRGGMHFVDVRDVAAALVEAMRLHGPRPVYHLPGTASSLDAFFRQVAEVAGLRPRWKRLPRPVLHGLASANAALGHPLSILPDPVVVEMASHYWDARSRYSAHDLRFHPRPPRETLADTVAWLREHHPDLRPDGA